MSVALVPRPAARRAARPHPLASIATLAPAAALTLALAGALASLIPANAFAGDTGRVFGPVRLAPVQVIASR